MKLSHFAVRHPVVIGMLLIVLGVFGALALSSINIEFDLEDSNANTGADIDLVSQLNSSAHNLVSVDRNCANVRQE